MSSEKKTYVTSFTPLGEVELDKKCQGPCGRQLKAVKFGMKYSVRNGVKGRIRNSWCLDCKNIASKNRVKHNEKEIQDRLIYLEDKSKSLELQLKNERDLNIKINMTLTNLVMKVLNIEASVNILESSIK